MKIDTKGRKHKYASCFVTALLIVVLTAGSAFLSGCGDGAENNRQQRYAWPLCTASPEDTVTQQYAEKFAEEVDRLSGGQMAVQVYSNSMLGGDRELLESCRDGDIPFVMQNTAPQVGFLPELAVFDLPCAFDTLEEARQAVDGEQFYGLVEEIYEKGGYKLLGYGDQGFRVLTTNKKIQKLADFEGQKIRTMENPYHIEFWQRLGASPTPMNFGEVYIGLQQSTIDAQENPYEVIVSGKLYEQQDYLVETNHLPHYISFIVSEKFFATLTREQQTIVVSAAAVAKAYAREQSDDRILDKKQVIEDSGTKRISISEELRKQLRQVAEPIYEEIRGVAGDTLVDAYLGQ